MKTNLSRRRSLFTWNRKVLAIGGIWPLDRTYMRCNIWIIYLTIQLSFGIADMFDVINNVVLLSLSFSETIVQTMVVVKLIVLRYSPAFYTFIDNVKSTFNKNTYDSLEEEKVYMAYYNLATRFYQVMMFLGCTTPVCYQLKPLAIFFGSGNGTSSEYVLPIRTHLPFQIENTWTYALIYIYQTPMVYLNAVHTASVCFLITLVFHVCGRLSVLSYKIRNMTVYTNSQTTAESNKIFRDIVESHLAIIRMAESLDNTFGLVILEEIIGTTLMLGITSHILLICVEDPEADVAMTLTFVVWTAAAVMVIYGYCLAGECLITESTEVQDACYHAIWYDMPRTYKIPFIICMIRAQTPLRLTAAKFYHFTLANFTTILKTAMAYVSLLRTIE